MNVSQAPAGSDKLSPGGGSEAGSDESGGVALGEGGGGSSPGVGVVLAGGGVGLRRGVGVGVGSGSSSSSGELLFPASSGVASAEGVGCGVGFGLEVVPAPPVEVCAGVAMGVGVPATGVTLLSPAPVGDAPGCTGDAFGSAVSGRELSFPEDEPELRW